jgi:hypothetical protein
VLTTVVIPAIFLLWHRYLLSRAPAREGITAAV